MRQHAVHALAPPGVSPPFAKVTGDDGPMHLARRRKDNGERKRMRQHAVHALAPPGVSPPFTKLNVFSPVIFQWHTKLESDGPAKPSVPRKRHEIRSAAASAQVACTRPSQTGPSLSRSQW